MSEAAELFADGEHAEARALVMDVLLDDLRCIDAHAHLGNWASIDSPEQAIAHYEVGIAIGELSLARAPSDALLPWEWLYDRPFLRALHGLGLCEWRLGRRADAERTFARLFALNPWDQQGARFCWGAVRAGVSWEDFQDEDDEPRGLPS